MDYEAKKSAKRTSRRKSSPRTLQPGVTTDQVLALAMEVEKTGHAFYSQASERTRDPHGKQMFQRLAADELTHLNYLTSQLGELARTGHLLRQEPSNLESSLPRLGRMVFPESGGPGSMVRPDTSDLEALKRGIKAEKDSVKLYAEAARVTTDPGGQATFSRLVEVENDHLFLLEAEYDYLTKSGFYFGMPEFSVEGMVE